jgi:hypothetical protein
MGILCYIFFNICTICEKSNEKYAAVVKKFKLGVWTAVELTVLFFFGLWFLVNSQLQTIILEEHTAPIFNTDDGDSIFFRNVSINVRVYIASQPKTTLWPC